MIVVDTPQTIELYRAVALKHGLRLWAKHHIKPNSAWTAGAMLRAASSITGKPYKARQYDQAITDLQDWINRSQPQ